MKFERMTVEQIKESILNKLHTQFACDVADATPEQLYQALALVVRDEIMQRRSASRGARKEQQAKRSTTSAPNSWWAAPCTTTWCPW